MWERGNEGGRKGVDREGGGEREEGITKGGMAILIGFVLSQIASRIP